MESLTERELEKINDEITDAAERSVESLTERELEITRMFAMGAHTTREIAQSLSLSEQDVERQLRMIYNKFHITSRSELAQALSDTGLDEPSREPRRPADD